MDIFKFELGEILKDKVTGFQGVVMSRIQYFTDCNHYGLCAQALKDGKPIDWEHFDETRLVRVKGAKPILREPRIPTSGVFQNPPKRG